MHLFHGLSKCSRFVLTLEVDHVAASLGGGSLPSGEPKTPKLTHFQCFGGTENGTSDARIKILRQLFNTNTPQNPHLDTLGTILDPRKVILSHFVLFVEFWSFSWAGGYFFWEGV